MSGLPIPCTVCGRTGQVTSSWAKVGEASGVIMTGLDPENCSGCHSALRQAGYATMRWSRQPDGTWLASPVPPPRQS